MSNSLPRKVRVYLTSLDIAAYVLFSHHHGNSPPSPYITGLLYYEQRCAAVTDDADLQPVASSGHVARHSHDLRQYLESCMLMWMPTASGD